MPQFPPRRRIFLGVAAGLGALALAACATPSSHTGTASTPGTDGSALSGTLTVSAAASMQEVLPQISEAFTKEHPDVTFSDFSFDGSSVLATQIIGGAPVDVFASADQANMTKVVDADLVAGDPVPFATSTLQIAVAPGNPLRISSLADLAKPGADGRAPIVVICAPEVPCGAASQQLLQRDGVSLRPASEEQSVSSVLAKVSAGEADAGLVYRSDVIRADGAVAGIDIAHASDAAGLYLIAPLTDSASPPAARAFAEFLRSPDAQRLLEQAGFGPPHDE